MSVLSNRNALVLLMALSVTPATGQVPPAQRPPVQPRRGMELTTSQRRALVIGNTSYPQKPLLNPGNDATDLAAALPDAGFNVTLRTDLDNKALERAVIDFSETVQPGDTALFFFSGHGLEVEGGQNYLLPLDFAAKAETDVKYQAVAAGRVQELLQARKAQTVILILDACRNNPYKSWSRASGGGLAGMSGESVYIAFAAAAGKQADDNPGGRNGIFTKHLLANLRAPGLPIDEVFNRVRRGVAVDTKGKQVPFSNSGLIDPFVFIDPAEVRQRLEARRAELDRQLAEANRINDAAAVAAIEAQKKLAQQQFDLLPPAQDAPVPDTEIGRLMEEVKQKETQVLRQTPATMALAKAEVASLEKNLEANRREVYATRDEALRRLGVQRGKYEEADEYEARRKNAEAKQAEVTKQFETLLAARNRSALDRIALLTGASYPIEGPGRVEWKDYEIDRHLATVAIDGVMSKFPMPGAKAQALDALGNRLKAETTWDGAQALINPITGERFKGTPAPWINPKDGLEYVRIAPGSFMMGCSPGDPECSADEKPAHRVTLTKGFRIGATPVTQEAYQRVTRTNPSNFKGAKLPVETVNWTDAQEYCLAVGMRLPTEAEWEYAARAGSPGARYGNVDSIAWYEKNSDSKTHDVAQKQPNAWGLYDMLGNVWQWTGDWYAVKYQGSDETDPKGPTSGQYRALRGGSWLNYALRARASGRFRSEPSSRGDDFGFRCVGE